jgi:hypothetical protein
MMPIQADAPFFQSLYQFDYDLFLQVKARGCPHCGSPLDTSNFRRKLRGSGEEQNLRLSLCCRSEGCRKRLTPPSLRFFGRKIYSRWLIILVLDFVEHLGLSKKIVRQTLARWRIFWKTELAETSPFMRWARGFLSPELQASETPKNIVSAFQFPMRESWIPVLKFFTQLI